LFAISADELDGATDMTLPKYDDVSSKISGVQRPHTLALGNAWSNVHALLGGHEGDHPLSFMIEGGAAVPAFDDGERSSGRFFSPELVAKILIAIARMAMPPEAIDRLRVFVAEVAATGNGLIVHRFV
jgi:hypothetical protein